MSQGDWKRYPGLRITSHYGNTLVAAAYARTVSRMRAGAIDRDFQPKIVGYECLQGFKISFGLFDQDAMIDMPSYNYPIVHYADLACTRLRLAWVRGRCQISSWILLARVAKAFCSRPAGAIDLHGATRP